MPVTLSVRPRHARHAIGSCHDSLAACFSFHPVKTIAMGEGGAVTTNSKQLADEARRLRNHGMSRMRDFRVAELGYRTTVCANPWYYEVARSATICAPATLIARSLCLSCASSVSFVDRRRELMAHYGATDGLSPAVTPHRSGRRISEPGWHLCAVLIDFERDRHDRRSLMPRLTGTRDRHTGALLPVNLQPVLVIVR